MRAWRREAEAANSNPNPSPNPSPSPNPKPSPNAGPNPNQAEATRAHAAAHTRAEAHADLYPPLSACLARDFFGYYQSNASSLTFEALYTNAGGLTDKFGAHWALVARAVADAPNVLMHEVINEPWPGDIYSSRYWFPFQWCVGAPLQPSPEPEPEPSSSSSSEPEPEPEPEAAPHLERQL